MSAPCLFIPSFVQHSKCHGIAVQLSKGKSFNGGLCYPLDCSEHGPGAVPVVHSGLETGHGEQQTGPGPLSGTVVPLVQPLHVHESMTTRTCYSLKVLGCSVAQEISLQGLDSLV